MSLYKHYKPNTPRLLVSVATEDMDAEFELPKKELDDDLKTLDEHTHAYESMTDIHTKIVTENFSYVDKDNYFIYNECVKQICRSIRATPPTIATETIEHLPTTALNHTLALEGFIGSLWEKIKAIFASIYNKIKKFLAGIFIRNERVRQKIDNLLKALEATTKDNVRPSLDSVPSALTTFYPHDSTLTAGIVLKCTEFSLKMVTDLKKVVDTVSEIAGRGLISREWITSIKVLMDRSNIDAKTASDLNNSKAKGFKALPAVNLFTKAGDKNREIEGKVTDLKKNVDENEKEVKSRLSAVQKTVSDDGLSQSEAGGAEKVKEDLTELSKSLQEIFSGWANATIIKGISIKVTMTDSGIELDMDQDGDAVNSVGLATRDVLKNILNTAKKAMENLDPIGKAFSTLNDDILKKLDTVDDLLKHLDTNKVSTEISGAVHELNVATSKDAKKTAESADKHQKNAMLRDSATSYKKVVQNHIKPRLTAIKQIFSEFNKSAKLITENIVLSAEGAVAYTVLSMKYFGNV